MDEHTEPLLSPPPDRKPGSLAPILLAISGVVLATALGSVAAATSNTASQQHGIPRVTDAPDSNSDNVGGIPTFPDSDPSTVTPPSTSDTPTSTVMRTSRTIARKPITTTRRSTAIPLPPPPPPPSTVPPTSTTPPTTTTSPTTPPTTPTTTSPDHHRPVGRN